MGDFSVGELVGLVLTAGGAAFVTALLAGVKDLRRGAAGSRREAVKDLMIWRDDLDEARKVAQADADFWRDLAGERGGQLRDHGIVPANPYPVPPSRSPSERQAEGARAVRQRRWSRTKYDRPDRGEEEP